MKNKIYKILISVILIMIIVANSITTTAISISSVLLNNDDMMLLSDVGTKAAIIGDPSGYAMKGSDGGAVIYRIYKDPNNESSKDFDYYNLLCVNHGKHISYSELTSGNSVYRDEDTRNTVFTAGNTNKAMWLLDNVYVAENINDDTKKAMKDNLKEIMKTNTSYPDADINNLIDSICVDYSGDKADQYYEIYSIVQILLWQYTNNTETIYNIDDNNKLYTGSGTNLSGYTQEVTGNYKWLYETLKTIADSKEGYISPNINEDGMKSELDKIRLTNGTVDLKDNSITFDIESNNYNLSDLIASVSYEVQVDNTIIETDKYATSMDSNKLVIKMNDNSGINLAGKTVKIKMNMTGLTTDGHYITSSKQDIQNLISIDKNIVTASTEGQVIIEEDTPEEPHKGIKEVYNQDSGYYDDVTGAVYKDKEDLESTLHDWVITSRIPSGIDRYSKYIITDPIDDRLEFTGLESVKVSLLNGETLAKTKELTKDTDYQVNYDEQTKTLKVSFIEGDFKEGQKLETGSIVEIRFNTTFAKDEEGNIIAINESVENKATLTYVNSSGNEVSKDTETPEVHTGGVGLYKYDEKTGKALAGAKFKIATSKENAENGIFVKGADGKDVEKVTNEKGIALFEGLEFGEDAMDDVKYKTGENIYGKPVYKYDWEKVETTYYIVETEAPAGYSKIEGVIEAVVKKDNYDINDIETLIKVGNESKIYDLALRKFITKVDNKEITDRVPKVDITPLLNASNDSNNTNEPSADVVDNKTKCWNFLTKTMGYSDYVAAGIMGNIQVESDFNPQTENKNYYGLLQWTKQYHPGVNGKDIEEQLEFFKKWVSTDEFNTYADNYKYGFTYDEFLNMTDAGEAAKAFCVIMMRTGEDSSICDKKAQCAKEILEQMKDVLVEDSLQSNDNKATSENINTTAKYTHTKEPVLVAQSQIITYTIRIYNEGPQDAYASLIKDDIPEGLEFVTYIEGDGSINDIYRWKLVDESDNRVTDPSQAKYIVTDYLAKDEKEQNLLKGFDKDTMTELDYRDVQVQFKVTEPNTSDRILINQAQISEETDRNGNKVTDRDSTPNEWKNEDDEDIEKVRVLYFDLALRKWVTQAIVTENGQTVVTETGHKAEDDPEEVVKVDLKKSKLNNVTVKFRYSIRITNEGEIAGEATEIRDDIPNGLKFVAEDNPDWREENGQIVTNKLANTTLQPGESAEVEIVLTWVNSEDNMGVMVNTAEINKDHNIYGTPDIDSTPGNNVPGEDDIDDAPVMLTIKTGSEIIGYTSLALGFFLIIGLGINFIKRNVL